MATESSSSPNPARWPWGMVAVGSGVLMALSGCVVIALLGTPEGQQISQKWLVLPGAFLLAFVFAIAKLAIRRS